MLGLLAYLKAGQQRYGSALAFHVANALFQTASRFEELIQLTWRDCQRVGDKIVALRIKGKGSVFQHVPVRGRLSQALLEWKAVQETFKGRRIMAAGVAFAASQFVFAGYSGAPFSNRAFNLRFRATCRALGMGEITAHGLRHSAATILLNHVGKDLREIQELLRHKNRSFRKLVARILSTKDQGFCCASGKLVFVRGCDGRWTKATLSQWGMRAIYWLLVGGCPRLHEQHIAFFH